MKKSSLIAFLVIGFIFYQVTGGGILLGLWGGYGGASKRGVQPKPPVTESSVGQQQNPFMDNASGE